MPVLKNISFLAQCKAVGTQEDIHLIEDAALVWKGSTISWVGKREELPVEFNSEEIWDANGMGVVPGLIDCHTHLAFGGWREDEYVERLRGISYLDIAKRGGGIQSTVKMTRLESIESLVKRCEIFLNEISKLGVTTVECKSGYGLTLEDELKLLRVYKTLNKRSAVKIVSTFLGAHTIPPEYSDRERYIREVVLAALPIIASEELAQFCDVFVEESAFSVEEARLIFEQAARFNLRAKIHADQFSDSGGAGLAAEVLAASADHLEHSSNEGLGAMAKRGVVAVLLPLASLYTHKQPVDAKRLREAGLKIAVATDFNPGTAPSYHLPLTMMLTCNLNRLTPRETLKSVTINAATAIGLEKTCGSLEAGKMADFILLDVPSINFWLYHFNGNACRGTVKDGKAIFWPKI